jgi:DNA polymerase III subunit epsilon
MLSALPEKLVFVDLETTGARAGFDQIIEIGIIRVENNTITKTYHSLINPERHLPPQISVLTGITAADLETAPTFQEIADEIYELLDDCIFVAHNVRFDYSFLKSSFSRIGLTYSSKHICTVKLSRQLFPRFKRHNLDSIIERFNFTCDNRHRAFDDAKVLVSFYQHIREQFPEEKICTALNLLLKKPSLPTRLSASDLEKLPEAPGVYMFYGENGVPLYIGKSKNIRNRVLSHFSGDLHSLTEMKISQQIESIETITTAGELGALFLESDLIKKHLPLYNKKLRVAKQLIAVKCKRNDDGYDTTYLEPVSTIDINDLYQSEDEKSSYILGFFKSQKQAKTFLAMVAKEYTLCEKLLGLEKTSTACFAARLGRCNGACTGDEKSLFYNVRFLQAFQKTKIKPWPFHGPIVIEEREAYHAEPEYLLIDKWCYLGRITLDEYGNDSFSNATYTFDLDIYKILTQYLRAEKNIRNIKLLSEQKFISYTKAA